MLVPDEVNIGNKVEFGKGGPEAAEEWYIMT
jgi:hypothetical protein